MAKKEILFGLIIAIFLALFLSPFASWYPDGLEKVAEEGKVIEKIEVKPVIPSPVPDYAWPGIKNERIATSIAGVVGTIIVFCMGYGIAILLKRRKTQ